MAFGCHNNNNKKDGNDIFRLTFLFLQRYKQIWVYTNLVC